jgi:hypothetical protein
MKHKSPYNDHKKIIFTPLDYKGNQLVALQFERNEEFQRFLKNNFSFVRWSQTNQFSF